jgi:NADPH:quinone reductase-like Zn-dependent oxidoreductase
MDWKFASGGLPEHMPAVFPMVIGSDAAGEVAAVGESVSRVLAESGMSGVVIVSGVACGDGGGGYPAPYRLSPRHRRQRDYVGTASGTG